MIDQNKINETYGKGVFIVSSDKKKSFVHVFRTRNEIDKLIDQLTKFAKQTWPKIEKTS